VKRLLETLARELVSEKSRVSVDEWTEDGILCLELRVAKSDRGRVIGKNGRTADALRTLLAAVANERGQRCELEIVD
jgi:predicted RNA-binding protein YlqC (UPF0109 family)